MSKKFLSLIFLVALMTSAWSQEVKVMSYNIRYDDTKDSINGWAQRKHDVLKIIEESGAKIIGVQEALLHQIKDLDQAFLGFEYAGVGRDNGYEHGEFSAIFYDTTLYQKLKTETFWLSDMPERPSYGWDAAFRRICTVVQLKDLDSGTDFWVLNTHFDHMGYQARKKSAELVLKKIKQFNPNNQPLILMGDFNVNPFEKPYKTLTHTLQDSREAAKEIMGKNLGTYNGFYNEFLPKRIDYIFSNQLEIIFYTQINDKMRNGNYPSDHFPILVLLDIEKINP